MSTTASEGSDSASIPFTGDGGLFETWASDDAGDVCGGRPPVKRLGRYELREGIGAGGMGEVYRAYDPELDREIAIKRLGLGEQPSDARHRLLREGQAIARLSHPHVVQVYDVGTDPSMGDMFIAMELIEGSTLRGWLRREAPTWKVIAAVFAQAGEGLAAAHARGIVHRDFKPENVLVTRDGIAKVVDFGLAKPSVAAHESQASHSSERVDAELDVSTARRNGAETSTDSRDAAADDSLARRPSSGLHSELTPRGARLGTPAYMPPEQHGGESSDPRIDQFAFAVALYEAWVGHLPFAGANPTEYAISVLEGAVRPFPRDCPVPRRLQRALLRALSVDPHERFEDMRPLLHELRRDPAKQRRRIAALTGAIGLGGLCTFVIGELVREQPDASTACNTVAEAARKIWSSDRRQALVDALAAVPSPLAEDTATRIASALDAWSDAWADARRGACLAISPSFATSGPTRAHASSLAGAERLCLDRNLARQRNLIDTLERATPEMLEHALHAMERIAFELERCGAPAYLEQIVAEETMAEDAREQAVQGLALARQHLDLGEIAEGLAQLESMGSEEIRATWPAALILQWVDVRGRLEGRRGDLRSFREVLEQGALLGLGGTAPIAAAEWHIAHGDVLYELDEVEQADRAYARAQAIFEQRSGVDAIETILARGARGHLPFARGRYEEALAIYAEAAEAAAVVVPPTSSVRLTIDEWVAEALASSGKFAEASARARSIIDRHEQSRGLRHPKVVTARLQLGIILLRGGDTESALASFEQALALFDSTPAVGDSLERATILANIGAARTALGDHDEAGKALEAALAAFRKGGLDADNTRVLAIRANLAQSLSKQGRRAEAIPLLEEILAGMERAGIQTTNNGLMVQLNLATALLEEGRPHEALPVVERALAIEAAHADLTTMATLYTRLAEALRALHRPREADDARAKATVALQAAGR